MAVATTQAIEIPGSVQPNPFSARTSLSFALPANLPVRLEVFDVRGYLVSTVVDGVLDAGPHTEFWDGRHRGGAPAANGTYVLRLTAGSKTLIRKALLAR